MSVLVTGGAGYIGSHMVLALLEAGRKVVVVDNLASGFADAVHPDAQLLVGDVGDRALLDRVMAEHQVETVIHFAASTVVPESVAQPLKYYRNNTLNSVVLLEAAVAAGTQRFVFSSTAAVYGTPSVDLVSEDAPLQPLSPYGASKAMVERALRDTATAHGMGYVALRYFNVAGADPAGRVGQRTAAATHLIKVACEAAVGRRPGLEVFGTDYDTPDGSAVRDYIHVTDLVQAHLRALEHLDAGGESLVLNCGYGHGSSVLEVVEAVKRLSGMDFPVSYGPRRPGDAARVVADCSRIERLLGWRPQWADLDLIVGHALAWEGRSGAGSAG